MSNSSLLGGVNVPARGPEEGRLVERYGVVDPLRLSVKYTGPDMEALKARALARWTSSWSSPPWPWWWTHFHLKKRRALLHQRFFFLALWVFFDSSLEMGFWSLKWMESMDLAVSRFCFLASSNTFFFFNDETNFSQSENSYTEMSTKKKKRERKTWK